MQKSADRHTRHRSHFQHAGIECRQHVFCWCAGGRREAATYDEGDAEDKELRAHALEEVCLACVHPLNLQYKNLGLLLLPPVRPSTGHQDLLAGQALLSG